jgi:signal transduction histidine kinase
MNEAASRFIGHPLEVLKGKQLQELSELSNGMFDQVLNEKNYVFRKGGTQSYRIQAGSFIDRGCDTRFLLIEDISYEIFKTEKYAYEKVIRMMSHEVNNTVGAVNSILTSVQPKLDHWPEHQQAVDVCVQRNGHMNQFMANFADVVRIPQPMLKPVNIMDCIRHAILITKGLAGNKACEVLFTPSQKTILVNADGGQLEQALINILKNALEAIDEKGRIEIKLGADPVQVRIIDNGAGIPDHLKENLFTPFYTSKPNGQGIGLTVTREILINHQCQFSLESSNGQTEFLIRFPD